MKQRIIYIIIMFSSLFSFSQNKNITISGYVKDKQSKETLIGASIYLFGSNIGVSTNSYGFFSLTVPNTDTIRINISYIGFETQQIVFLNKEIKDKPLIIELKSGLNIDEVIVKAERKNNVVRREETSVTQLNIKQIKKLPNLFGEVDIIKALQLTPGVQSGGEGKSSLYVRGGSPDQNLYLLDDVPLYYVGHFGGFFSVFNADAINSVKLIKGGFPAKFGSRLSSVLDIRMKDGNMQKAEYQGTVGLLSSKISVSAPLIKDKSSFIVSVRGNILPLFKIMGAPLNYYFFDANAKVNYILSDNNRLFLSFYMGEDFLWDTRKNEQTELKNLTKWGNTLGALRWNHIYNNKLFSNLTISDTHYRYKTNMDYTLDNDSISKKTYDYLTSGINDLSLKLDYSYFYNSHFNFKFGLNSIYHTFTTNDEEFHLSGTKIVTVDSTYTSKIEALENALYIENHLRFNLLTSNIGLRLTSYHIGTENYYALEPRILLNYIIREDISFKYSFSKMNQYVHLLSYSGTGVPNDYWMPTTENIKPESSIQHTLGLTKTFNKGVFELTIEAYHKTMDNMISFTPGKSLSGNLSDWESLVETDGKGENYGLELFFQKTKGKTTGWIGATLARAYRQFDKINKGEAYYFKYDRLFNFSIVAIHQLKKHINVSATWTYGTGYPITLASSKYYEDGKDVLLFDKKNAYRMRDYHRLDIAINFQKKTKWGERTWSISIFNVYNRSNPYYYYYDREVSYSGSGTSNSQLSSTYGNLTLYQRSLFSFFPSVAYSFKF